MSKIYLSHNNKTKKRAIIMKAILYLIILAAMFMSANEIQTKPMKKSKVLIAYFSHSGNTKIIAEMIANATKGDMFEIKPVKDYPNDYQTVVDQAKKEIKANYHPELKNYCKNISDYDVIIIGSPNWWGTIAPPVATFLLNSNLKGKTILPFITHEGSGMGRVESDIKTLIPGLNLRSGLAIRGSNAKGAQSEVKNWLRTNKIIE